MNNIYLIVGPSGSGKTTLTDSLEENYGYRTIKSYTDRPPRGEDDTSHIFVTPEQFDELGEMVAYTKYNGHRYGVPAWMIDEYDTYVIDPAGIQFLKEHYHGSKGIVVIGLTLSQRAAYWRQLMRGDAPDSVFARLATDVDAFENFIDICDYVINTELNDAFQCMTAVHHYITIEERKHGLTDNNL